MTQQPLTPTERDKILFDLYVDCGRNVTEAARQSGYPAATITAARKRHTRVLSRLERGIIEALEGTTLDFEGLCYGYLEDYSDAAIRRAIQRLRRYGLIESDPTARRGFYRLPRTEETPS